jgi:hypothetical protein
MLRFPHLPCIFGLILLSGCGVGSPSSSTYPNITGNWALAAETPFVDFPFGGYITSSNGVVSGTIHVTGCLEALPTEDFTVSGTLSPSGVLVATATGTSSGQSIKFGGTVSGNTLSGGTYSWSGLCLPGLSSGPLLGTMVPSYSNTYTGSFVSSVSGLTIGTTIIATQSGPDSDGFYHLSGTASFTESPCFSSGSITGSDVAGAFATVTIATNNGSTVTFTGVLTGTGNTITGEYQVSSGSCNGDNGTGSVSHS